MGKKRNKKIQKVDKKSFNGSSGESQLHYPLTIDSADYYQHDTDYRAYYTLPYVHMCIKKIAEDISSRRILVGMEGSEEMVDIKEKRGIPEFRPFLEDFEGITFQEKLAQIVNNLELSGNCIIVTEAKSVFSYSKGELDSFEVVPSKYVNIMTSHNGSYLIGYYLSYTERTIHAKIEDVIHLRKPTVLSKYRGVSSVVSSSLQLSTEFQSDKMTNRFFRNSGNPSFVLSMESIAPAERDRLLRDLQKKMNTDNFGSPVIFEGEKIEVHSISSAYKDMEFVEQKRLAKDMIFALFQVPKEIVGLSDKSEMDTYQAKKAVYQEALNTKMMMIENSINAQYFKRKGSKYRITFEKYRTIDQKGVVELLNASVLTFNEARDLLGLKKMPDCDIFFRDILQKQHPITEQPNQGKPPAVKV